MRKKTFGVLSLLLMISLMVGLQFCLASSNLGVDYCGLVYGTKEDGSEDNLDADDGAIFKIKCDRESDGYGYARGTFHFDNDVVLDSIKVDFTFESLNFYANKKIHFKVVYVNDQDQTYYGDEIVIKSTDCEYTIDGTELLDDPVTALYFSKRVWADTYYINFDEICGVY